MEIKQAERIQTSILNGLEKKALVWLAQRQPRWVTPDFLSFIGFCGSLMIATGYALTRISPSFLWLATVGLLVNWYGDSLDGTLARVRKIQRPIYGYYLDHSLDCINEMLMFIGLGLSPLMDMRISMLILIAYLLLTVNVSVNAHLKGQFRLTYAKIGPTEFRIIAAILNTVLVCSTAVRSVRVPLDIFGTGLSLTVLDICGLVIFTIIFLMYLVSFFTDAKGYAGIDPPKK